MNMVESLPKSVENTIGKEENARYKQFLLFPQCFQRLVLQTRKNGGGGGGLRRNGSEKKKVKE